MLQPSTQEIQEQAQLGGKGDPFEILQEIQIRPCKQIVCCKLKSLPENETHNIFWDFKILTDHLIIFTNPSARVGCDTRSIFKRSLTDLNSEFYFS